MVNHTVIGATGETISVPLDPVMGIIQALGGLLFIYIIVKIISIIINWKKNKEIKKMREDIKQIKKMLSKKKKKK